MLGPLTPETLHDHLTAFADGELDAAQSLALWAYLENDPHRAAHLERVREHQRLSAEAQRVLQATPATNVRERISALVDQHPASEPEPAGSINTGSRTRRRPLRYALAAAAGLLLGVSSTAFVLYSRTAVPVIPDTVIADAGRTHSHCSRLPPTWHDSTFEEIDAQLASTMRVSLNQSTSAPDFSTAGFQFTGAGPCHGAGGKTVHLLYRSSNRRSATAVSLFVSMDVGQYPMLEAGRIYRVSSPSSPFPTLAWKTGQVVCVLLGDNERDQSAILQLIRPTAPTDIVTVASR